MSSAARPGGREPQIFAPSADLAGMGPAFLDGLDGLALDLTVSSTTISIFNLGDG